MSTIYMLEAVNLFCGDHDPKASKHLTLTEMKLPDLQAMYVDHHPGGGKFQVELEVGFQKIEPTFKLAGFDPDLLQQFGLGTRHKHVYTAYGHIRNKRSGKDISAKAVIEARLGKAAPDAFSKGELVGHEYALNEVMAYRLVFDGKEIFDMDFWTNTWRVGGVDQNKATNRILRVPNAG